MAIPNRALNFYEKNNQWDRKKKKDFSGGTHPSCGLFAFTVGKVPLLLIKQLKYSIGFSLVRKHQL